MPQFSGSSSIKLNAAIFSGLEIVFTISATCFCKAGAECLAFFRIEMIIEKGKEAAVLGNTAMIFTNVEQVFFAED